MTKDRPMPADWQRSAPFAGVLTFMGAPTTRDLSHADVAIIGAPLDIGTTYRSGARFGPRAIRESTGPMELHAWEEDELREPFRSLRVIDYGDLSVSAGYIEAAVERIEKGLSTVLDADVFPIVLGGDHTISLPVLRALYAKYGKLSLLHFDAHPDFWEPNPERPMNHGTQVKLAADESLIDPNASAIVGIRGSSSMAILDDVKSAGITAITTDEIDENGIEWAVNEARRATGDYPVHVSLDIDLIDPAFAPGTGVPEIAGLTSREAVKLIRGLKGMRTVGFDIVEVAPPYDHAEITAYLAANLVYEFLLTLVK